MILVTQGFLGCYFFPFYLLNVALKIVLVLSARPALLSCGPHK